MKQNEFALLVSAGAIESVTIYRDSVNEDAGWSVWAYGEYGRTRGVPAGREYVEAARGGMRTWASLDTAYRWIREQGWKGTVQIDESH